MSITLYSTHCPKCEILKKKLNEKSIDYKEINDTEYMLSKGFTTVPMLEVDDKTLNFAAAIKWVTEVQQNYE